MCYLKAAIKEIFKVKTLGFDSEINEILWDPFSLEFYDICVKKRDLSMSC